MSEQNQTERVRHILNISGGKDSTALAVFMKTHHPQLPMEYVFCDTGKELKETMEYLDQIEQALGIKIVRLNSEYSFEHWMKVFNSFLPSPRARWCTKVLKLQPFEKYVGNDTVHSYIAIRADEDREGYISTKPNIIPKFPFREAGITKKDVFRLLEESGLGLPKYYRWRSRSGCFFCFFQQRIEWVGLKENHPELFEEAKRYEKVDPETGQAYTWVQGKSLVQIEQSVETIKENHQKALAREKATSQPRTLFELFDDVIEEQQEDRACLICEL
jgi:3'-phosphoadenosine 5'-phosphosulfate sulfotransferase (PAPS reductase)/FAD synthetase